MSKIFDGNTANYLYHGAAILPYNYRPSTFSCWCRSNVATPTSKMALMSQYATPTPASLNLAWYPRTTGRSLHGGFGAGIYTTSTSADHWSESKHPTLDVGRAYHVVGVWEDDGSRQVFVDGVASPKAIDGPDQTSRIMFEFTIGADGVEGSIADPWDGEIWDAVIWDVKLSPDEIAALYRGVRPERIRPSLIEAHWPLGYDLVDINEAKNLTENGTVATGGSRIINPSYNPNIGIPFAIDKPKMSGGAIVKNRFVGG